MTELILEPFVAKLHFRLTEPAGSMEWKQVLAAYMEDLSRRCTEAGPCVIGHIKGLIVGPDKSYLRISVIDAIRPAESEGELPEESDNLTMTLNVIVYGLPRDRIYYLVRQGMGVSPLITVEPIKGEHRH